MASGDPTSLRGLTSQKIEETLRGVIADLPEENLGLVVLVVDTFVLNLLDSTVGLAAVIDCGFLVVEMFESERDVREGKRRRPYPELPVVYFFKEDDDDRSVDLICRDFEDDVRADTRDWMEKLFPCIFKGIPPEPNTKLQMYKEARIVTISGIRPTNVYTVLERRWHEQSPRLDRLRYALKREGDVQECTVEYVAWESNLFSLESFRTLSTLYNYRLLQTEHKTIMRLAQEEREKHVIDLAVGIASACITLDELPIIRYSKSGRSKSRTEDMAFRVHQLLTGWKKANKGFAKSTRDSQGTLLIVDRVDDIAPALLHDMTYGGLIVDMLNHDPYTPYVYNSVDKKGRDREVEVHLDERDPVYVKLRGMEIHHVSECIDKDVKARKETGEKEAKKEGLDAARQAMKRLINDDALYDSKYIQHVDMCHSIFEAIAERNFRNILNLEQAMVTGLETTKSNDEFNKFTYKDAINAIKPMFDETDPGYLKNKGDQLRLLMLLVLTQPKLEGNVLKDLMNRSKIGDAGKAMINNLVNLHVPLGGKKIAEGAPDFSNKDKIRDFCIEANELDHRVRYLTKVEDAVRGIMEGKLSKKSYPVVLKDGKVDNEDDEDGVGETKGGDEDDDEDTPRTSAAAKPVALSARTRTIKKRGGEDTPAATAVSTGSLAQKLAKFRKYRGRIIVFIIGGITQMELNALNNLAALTQKEIIIGSTCMLTARDFVLEIGETEPQQGDDDDEDDENARVPPSKRGEDGKGGKGSSKGAGATSDRIEAARRAKAQADMKKARQETKYDSDADDDDAPPKPRGGAGGPSRGGKPGKGGRGRDVADVDVDIDSDD